MATGRELVQILDSLVDRLQSADVPDVFFDSFLEELNSSRECGPQTDPRSSLRSLPVVLGALVQVYAEIRSYHICLHVATSPVKSLLEAANYRHRIAKDVSAMHAMIESLPRLNQRSFLDAFFAAKFAAAGIDWYGRQWLDLTVIWSIWTWEMHGINSKAWCAY